MDGVLGVHDFDLGGLRIVRVMQHGREIPHARVRVGLGETITGLEVMVAR